MRFKFGFCDICKNEIVQKNAYYTSKYEITIKEKRQHHDWAATGIPLTTTVSLCQNCFENLCNGIGIKDDE